MTCDSIPMPNSGASSARCAPSISLSRTSSTTASGPTWGGVLADGFDVLHMEQLWCGWLGLDHVERTLLSVSYLLEIDLSELKPRTVADWKTKVLGLWAEKRLLKTYRHFSDLHAEIGNPHPTSEPDGRRDDRPLRAGYVVVRLHTRRPSRPCARVGADRLDELGAEPLGGTPASDPPLARNQAQCARRHSPDRWLGGEDGPWPNLWARPMSRSWRTCPRPAPISSRRAPSCMLPRWAAG